MKWSISFHFISPLYISTFSHLFFSILSLSQRPLNYNSLLHSSSFSLTTFIKSLACISRMSSRRSRESAGVSRISDDQIIDLISKLQQLLPEIRNNRRSNKASASKVLQETCNYVRSLHKEVDDLSDRLSQLLSTIDSDSPEASIIRSLIM